MPAWSLRLWRLSRWRGSSLDGSSGGLSPLRRWYFRADAAAEATPAFDGRWDETDGAVRRLLGLVPLSTDTIADGSLLSWAAGQAQLDRQYVSPPLSAGYELSGVTVTCVIRGIESDADDNATPRLGVRVLSATGSLTELLAVGAHAGAAEYSAADRETRLLANNTALANYTTSNGDRLVVELGHGDSSGTTPSARYVYGSSAASDYAPTAGLTTALNAWIEFYPH